MSALDLTDHELLVSLVTQFLKRLEALEDALRTIDITLERVATAIEEAPCPMP